MDFDGLSEREKERVSEEGEPLKKRMKLRTYDLMPAQALNSMGESNIEGMTLLDVKKCAMTGHKGVFAFSEFADADPKRQGIAISRLAEVLSVAMTRMQDERAKLVIERKLYERVMAELTPLKNACSVLNGGTAGLGTYQSLRYAARGNQRMPDEVSKAAVVMYDWLKKETSPLRSVLAFLSGAGAWYAAAVHDKTARAFLQGMEKQQFINIAQARLCSYETKADDMNALR